MAITEMLGFPVARCRGLVPLVLTACCLSGSSPAPAQQPADPAAVRDAASGFGYGADLAALRIEMLAAAERRAVVSRGDELFLLRPGSPLPGLPTSRVESIQPERMVVRFPEAKTALLTPAADGAARVEWRDGAPPPVPPVEGTIWITTDTALPGTDLVRYADEGVQASDDAEGAGNAEN